MGVVESELELVTAAERLIDVVLAGGIRLIAVAVPDRVGREVSVDDAGGVVGARLLIAAVLIGRKQDFVQAEASVEEEVLADDRVPQPLRQIEHVLFVAGGIGHGDRRIVQQPVRLAVTLTRIEAGEPVVLIHLIGEVAQP